jgi:hypothetical protein
MNVKAKMGKFTMKNYNHYDRHKLRNILRYIQGLVFLIYSHQEQMQILALIGSEI